MANGLHVGDMVGAVINGRWESLHIVGVALSPEYVYEIRGMEAFPDNKRFGVFWMSRDTLGPSFNMEGAFNDVVLSLAPEANETEVIARLDSILETYGGLGAYGREDQVSNRFLTDEIVGQRATGPLCSSHFSGGRCVSDSYRTLAPAAHAAGVHRTVQGVWISETWLSRFTICNSRWLQYSSEHWRERR